MTEFAIWDKNGTIFALIISIETSLVNTLNAGFAGTTLLTICEHFLTVNAFIPQRILLSRVALLAKGIILAERAVCNNFIAFSAHSSLAFKAIMLEALGADK